MQFPLAGKTAVGGIAAVVGIVELTGWTLLMADADPLRLRPRLLQQMGSQGRRNARHRDSGITLLFMGDRSHQGAVHTTGVGHAQGIV